MVNNVISLSGGKDSTAMLHMMLERGENIHSAIFFDTGWEFPEMHEHLDLVEQKTGVNIVRLEPEKSFFYWMFEHKQVGRETVLKGKLRRIGKGWPWFGRRWCTQVKTDTIDKYRNGIENAVGCIGYAIDEPNRARKPQFRYPLDEYEMTEADCLKYCKSLGYHWGGLYEIFDRVSCFCCPLAGQDALKLLREHRPELYEQVYEWDLMQPRHNQGFDGYESVQDLEVKWLEQEIFAEGKDFWFTKEKQQRRLF